MDATPGLRATDTGLVVTADPSRGAWAEFGAALSRRLSSSSWTLGDWIGLGERSWGDVYTQAAEVTGLDYGHLRNVRRVAARFELSRRRDKLTFAHHEAVAALPPAEADRLLDRAEREGLSRNRLRELAAGVSCAAAPDPLAEQLVAAVRAAARLRGLVQQLLDGPHAERLRTLLDRHHADPASLFEALSEFAAAPDLPLFDADPAADEDLAAGRYGRRV